MSYQVHFLSAKPLESAGNPSHTFTIYPDGTIDDGGEDDNFCIFPLESEASAGEIVYRAELQMTYTQGRARNVIEYIKRHLDKTDELELWKVWLGGYWGDDGWEPEPKIIRRAVNLGALLPEDIEKFLQLDPYGNPMKQYCLVVRA